MARSLDTRSFQSYNGAVTDVIRMKLLICIVLPATLVLSLLLPLPLNVFAYSDTDGDYISDELEPNYGTDPQNPDSDNDGVVDGQEVLGGTDPLTPPQTVFEKQDSDGDKLTDWMEYLLKTNRNNKDTDGDGHDDYTEVMRGFNPNHVSQEVKGDRLIEVNLDTQQLQFKANNVVIHTFPVSTGKPSTPTPPGAYKIFRKLPVARYRAYDYDIPNVKWNMEFRPSYFLHTAYWHNQFGKRTMSHGCVNIREKDAAILYEYMDIGVAVSIIGQTPKNGLVKKSAV